MRIPDPKANTTTEAYLAYKAGYLTQGELKPALYEPYLHFDAWLAYWCELTNEYPLDDNGNPEMLCDEEALVAYLAGVTDTYPEEIKDPYDVRIVGYLRHIANSDLPAPDYPVNNSEFYLSRIGHSVEPVVNPEPSSNFTLETSAGKLINVEIYGDTVQAESPAPSTDAPQDVLVVSGLQKITISDGGDNSKDYWLDLGGEMYDMNAVTKGKYINSSGATVTYSTWNTTDYMPVVAGEGYLYRGIRDAGRYPYSAYYDQDKVLVRTFKQGTGNNTLIIPDGVAYVRFSLANEDVGRFSFMSDGQSVELGSIAGLQDYIYKDGNDWYLHKEIAHYVADGSIGWVSTAASATYRLDVDPPCRRSRESLAGEKLVLSTHFQSISYNDRNQGIPSCVFASQSNSSVLVRNTPFSSESAINEFCAQTPVDFYYVAANATDTKITDARLVSQLNALLDGESYVGTTQIVVTSSATGIPALLKVTAKGLE